MWVILFCITIVLCSNVDLCRQRDALWASFQASVSTPPANGNGTPSAQPPPVKRVKIEKTYLFAGKHVTYVCLSFFHPFCPSLLTFVISLRDLVFTMSLFLPDHTSNTSVVRTRYRLSRDIVEVPEDSEEAKKWPRWAPRPEPTLDAASASASTPSCEKGKEAVKEEANGNGNSPTPPPIASTAAVPSPATSTQGAKRPGPRKPRTTLPSIPNKASQAKKITTLDKSAMDWRAHVTSQSSNVKDELDANRRGGGYLEKVEFLKRVEDRREDAFEANKASKRRKT